MINLPVLSSIESKKLDNQAHESFLIANEVLVENAGRTCVQALLSENIINEYDKILILVGSGNNGADGLIIAKVLHLLGFDVSIFECRPSKSTLNHNLIKCLKLLNANFLVSDLGELSSQNFETKLGRFSKIIDCITGTGFHGVIEDSFSKLKHSLNKLKTGKRLEIISVDIPSFNDCDTPDSNGFQANYTLAIQTLKNIHVENKFLEIVGRVLLVDAGIPVTEDFKSVQVTSKYWVSNKLQELFSESKLIHKGNRPHVLIVGGSDGKEGAAILSGIAALKTGSSIVKILSYSKDLETMRPPELMFEDINKSPDIAQLVQDAKAIIIGPGLGVCSKVTAVFCEVLKKAETYNKPVLVDADAIKLFAESYSKGEIKAPKKLVLTPHPKEFMSLMDCKSVDKVIEERFRLVKECANIYKACVLLKGPRSLVSDGFLTSINPHSEALLAVGGSGDVLSGIIGALLGRTEDARTATTLGVYLHGAVGFELSKRYLSNVGALASEIALEIPTLITRLKENSPTNLYAWPF